VAVDDALYVRPYNGQKSRWYQAAMRQKAGRITAAGMTKDVTFEPVNEAINDPVDDAYSTKYKGSSYLKPMIGSRARSADGQDHAARNQSIKIRKCDASYNCEVVAGEI